MADRHVTEAIITAVRRELLRAQPAAVAVRASVHAALTLAAGRSQLLFQGRYAADAASCLATRHRLVWHELDALRAQVTLDQAEYGYGVQVDALQARLPTHRIDPDLLFRGGPSTFPPPHPDPLVRTEVITHEELASRRTTECNVYGQVLCHCVHG